MKTTTKISVLIEQETTATTNEQTTLPYLNLPELKNTLQEQLKDISIYQKNYETKENELLHYVEYANFSASEGYMLMRTLKEIRQNRRLIKNRMKYTQSVLASITNQKCTVQAFADRLNVLRNHMTNTEEQYSQLPLYNLETGKTINKEWSYYNQVGLTTRIK